MKPKHFSHSVPFLPVRDLKETISYYRDQLGFSNEWYWEDSDAGIRRDELGLLFNKAPEYVSAINTPTRALEICWFVTNVDEIYEEFKSKEIKIRSQLKDEPWGIREFSIEDVNGYVIRIGQGLELIESEK